jgi:hypothetical protein
MSTLAVAHAWAFTARERELIRGSGIDRINPAAESRQSVPIAGGPLLAQLSWQGAAPRSAVPL